MKIDKFALKNKFSDSDTNIVNKIYGDEERSESEWFDLLENKIVFDKSSYLSEISKKEKIEKVKQKAKQAESKNK